MRKKLRRRERGEGDRVKDRGSGSWKVELTDRSEKHGPERQKQGTEKQGDKQEEKQTREKVGLARYEKAGENG